MNSIMLFFLLDYFAGKEDGSIFKAALLSGPPGVGKTTSASLVCQVWICNSCGISHVQLLTCFNAHLT